MRGIRQGTTGTAVGIYACFLNYDNYDDIIHFNLYSHGHGSKPGDPSLSPSQDGSRNLFFVCAGCPSPHVLLVKL